MQDAVAFAFDRISDTLQHAFDSASLIEGVVMYWAWCDGEWRWPHGQPQPIGKWRWRLMIQAFVSSSEPGDDISSVATDIDPRNGAGVGVLDAWGMLK